MRKKLAFIGGGVNSNVGKVHFSASQMDGLWSVNAGIFSKNINVSKKTAKLWNIDKNRVYSNFNQFIKVEKNLIDAVVVLTPTPDHYKIIIQCLKAGLNVICEKPICSSVKEIKKIIRICNKKKLFFAVTFNYTAYPMIREIRELIKKNKIGRVQQIHCEYPMEGFIRSTASSGEVSSPQKWRLKDNVITNLYLDLGTHIDSLLKYLIGSNPTFLNSLSFKKSTYKKIIDNIFIWLKYNKDIYVNCWISKTALGNRNGLKLRIFGSKGSLEWVQEKSESIIYSSVDGSKTIIDRGSNLFVANNKRYNRFKAGHPDGFIEAHANLYYDLHKELIFFQKNNRHSKKFFYCIENSLDGLRIGEMIKNNYNKKIKFFK